MIETTLYEASLYGWCRHCCICPSIVVMPETTVLAASLYGGADTVTVLSVLLLSL